MSPRGPTSVLLAALALTGVARADPSDEPPLELSVDVQLRAYAIFPKFRFRDGVEGVPGSSLRTQKLGLDRWQPGAGARVALWFEGTDALALDAWTFHAQGRGTTARPLRYAGGALAPGAPVHTEYDMVCLSLEYLHRFALLGDALWLDLGCRVEYLDFRVAVAGHGRTSLEGLWPTLRVRAGVRPCDWLELEGWAGGFELTVPITETIVTQPYEVGGAVRLRLPAGAYVELGGLMAHVHLEEDPGRTAEDALHLRHRALFVALGVTF